MLKHRIKDVALLKREDSDITVCRYLIFFLSLSNLSYDMSNFQTDFPSFAVLFFIFFLFGVHLTSPEAVSSVGFVEVNSQQVGFF